MSYDPEKHDRQSVRLPGYDYAGPGAYFITVNTYLRRHIFGCILKGKVVLSDFGEVVEEEWRRTAQLRPYVRLDIYLIMPDHFHAILWFLGSCGGTARRAPTEERFGRPVAGSLPTVMRSFKSACTRRINLIRFTPGALVWQPGYYDRVVRNEGELLRLRKYIRDNPSRWREIHS